MVKIFPAQNVGGLVRLRLSAKDPRDLVPVLEEEERKARAIASGGPT